MIKLEPLVAVTLTASLTAALIAGCGGKAPPEAISPTEPVGATANTSNAKPGDGTEATGATTTSAEPAVASMPVTPKAATVTPEELHAALKPKNPDYAGNGQFQHDGADLAAVSLANTGIRDISPLAGHPLQFLDLTKTRVVDLSPLRGRQGRERSR